MSPAFDVRVKSAFALGTPDREMGKVLQANGFARWDWSSRSDEEHTAFREEGDMTCTIDYFIYWTADPGGALTAIRGAEIAFCL